MQPYTVFTLADSDSMEKGQGYGVATLFQEIGLRVIADGEKAKLKAKVVEESLELCEGKSSNISKSIKKIRTLFQGQKSINIIKNKALNTELTNLAKHVSSYITTTNNNSAAFVETVFE
ncbi:hypothetical protein BGX21_006876 [Mortierella sp. AD011]|nr:hypothetical protein BGX20_006877 [Mortierella sp. AD010]KAF9368029.1 hypothetical protein BGX21_006876 [Mortierella sp. AD011]